MKGEIVCVVCPTSCVVSAEWDDTRLLLIDRAQCKLAWDYVEGEIFDPRRVVTTTVLVEGGDLPLVSVKTDKPVPKDRVLDVMDRLAEVVAKAPVDIGDTIVADVLRTGSNIVATNTIEKVS